MDFSPSVYEHAAGLIGKTPWEVSIDRELMVKAHQAAYERYHHTPITVGVDIYNVEAEAYGAKIEKPDADNIPSVQEALYSSAADLIAIDRVDLSKTGRWPLILDAAKELQALFPSAVVRIPVSGPFSIAVTLAGLENMLCDCSIAPDAAHTALKRLAQNQINLCREIQKQGLKITFFESAATPPLLSPKQFETILLPVLKDMLQEIKTITNEAPALIIGGDTAPILDYVLKTAAGYVICPSETDQQVFMEKIWDHTGVRVRVNMDAKIVAFGSHEDIQKEVGRIYTLSARRPNVCLGTGVLPYGTSPENVLFIENVLQRLQ